VQAVAATGSRVSLTYNDRTVNAASILGVLSVGVPHGATVVLESDDDRVLGDLVALLESGLNDS
jgi:phosphocarrier protein